MATDQMSSVLQHVRRAALLQVGGRTDGQLLQDFLALREEAAFEALVRRHGPMVLGVCRRVLANAQDAEDAFQATFLVLVRKAASLLPREGIGNWLYGVAYHTALKARAATARRRNREAQMRDLSRRDVQTEEPWQGWQPLLDQELSRLPDKYREPVVLCDLEGTTRREAARQLGIPEGTLSGRLTTARRMLARRLTRRGVTLSAGSLAIVLSGNAASAAVPAPLVASTVQAAALMGAGGTAAGVISARVAELMEGVLKAMFLTRCKLTGMFLMVIGLLAAGSGMLCHLCLAGPAAGQQVAAQALADEEARQRAEQPKDGTIVAGGLQAVDADKSSVTVSIFSRKDGQSTDKTFQVAKGAKVLRDGKVARLADLKKGSRVRLTLSADEKTAVSVSVTGSTVSAPLKSVDAEKRTITITVETRQGKQDRTYPVAKDARVTIAGKEAKLADLKEGATVLLTLSADGGNTVIQVQIAPPRRSRGEAPPAPKRNEEKKPTKSADVQKVLDRYHSARPDAKQLAIYQLDWAPTLKAAREKAPRDQKPILLVFVRNSYGNLYTGHC